MDLREALYTTRAMRRVKPDPVPEDVQQRIIDAAVRAPSGGNTQAWRFLLVDDKEVIARIAPLYRESIDFLWEHIYNERIAAAVADPELPESKQMLAIQRSVEWAADNFTEYPLLLLAFSQGPGDGGSIYPAVWSAMLAARAEGVGSSLTSILAVKAAEVTEILGVPTDEGWKMDCCVPMGYPRGRWGVAARVPAHEVTYKNHWGQATGWDLSTPLWTPPST